MLGLVLTPVTAEAAPWCGPATITAYDRYGFSSRFADGTSVYVDLPVVAASTDIRTGATVWIEGVGTFIALDRGDLGSDAWIDIAMDSYWAAKQFGRQTRQICVS